MDRISKSSLFLAVAVSLALVAANATGGTLSMADQNSSASVVITPSSTAGLTHWTVNSQDYARQQWFWYAIDGNAPAPLDSLTMTGSGPITFGSGSGTRGGYVTYSGSGLNVEVDYLLTGSSTATQSDLSETVRITNTDTLSSKLVHFYQYSNFNLSGGSSDTERFDNANTVSQFGGSVALQSVATPVPNEWEGYPLSTTLNGLNSGSSYTLHDTPQLITSGGTAVGPGNLSWAYQWDPDIAPQSTYLISLDEQINPHQTVPEPSSVAILFASGGIALMTGWTWRRRRTAA